MVLHGYTCSCLDGRSQLSGNCQISQNSSPVNRHMNILENHMILVLAIEHAQLVKEHVKNGYQTNNVIGYSRVIRTHRIEQ